MRPHAARAELLCDAACAGRALACEEGALDVAAVERRMLELALVPQGIDPHGPWPVCPALAHGARGINPLNAEPSAPRASASPTPTVQAGRDRGGGGPGSPAPADGDGDACAWAGERAAAAGAARAQLDAACRELGVPAARARLAALAAAAAALAPGAAAAGVAARRHLEPMSADVLVQALAQARPAQRVSRRHGCP